MVRWLSPGDLGLEKQVRTERLSGERSLSLRVNLGAV